MWTRTTSGAGPCGRPFARLAGRSFVGVTRSHGGKPLWAAVDLPLAAATTTVVTGPNGSGKTTLLRLAAGLLRPSTEVRHCAGRALYVRGGSGLRSAQTVVDAVTAVAGRAAHEVPARASGSHHRLLVTRLLGGLTAAAGRHDRHVLGIGFGLGGGADQTHAAVDELGADAGPEHRALGGRADAGAPPVT